MTNNIIEIQRKIVPEVLDLLEKRYNILLILKSKQPIGRRNLSVSLNISERHARNEIEFLQRQNLVEVERQGVILTEDGENIIEDLKLLLYDVNNIESMEKEIIELLNIKKVFIVPGDCEKNPQVLELMGQTCAKYISSILKSNMIIGLTGGSSVAAVAEQMPRIQLANVHIIPARGGIGKSHSHQANSIVALLADKLSARHEMLHIPDNVDEKILNVLKDYPDIKSVFDKFDKIDLMIFGIGRANTMAKWRKSSSKKMKYLDEKFAVAEAFGHYFDLNGNVVCPSSSVGIELDNYLAIHNKVAIAGGSSKAEAIVATCSIKNDLVLIMDESAAKAIIQKYK